MRVRVRVAGELASSVTTTVLNEVREIARPVSRLISRMFDAADRGKESEVQRRQREHGVYIVGSRGHASFMQSARQSTSNGDGALVQDRGDDGLADPNASVAFGVV